MKAIPTDLSAFGFDPSQFGSPESWDVNTPGGYLYGVLADVAAIIRKRVGESIYDSAENGSALFVSLKKAEIYLAAADLWRRLEQFQASNIIISRSGESALPANSRLLENARRFEDLANAHIDEALEIAGAADGIAVGVVQTGHYDEVRP